MAAEVVGGDRDMVDVDLTVECHVHVMSCRRHNEGHLLQLECTSTAPVPKDQLYRTSSGTSTAR